MVTKKDYEDAIKKIREAFYSSICDEWALEQIAVNLDFLSSLINEHFEEKVETNLDHHFEYLLTVGLGGFARVNGRLTKCLDTSCSKCGFSGNDNCNKKRLRWLASPYRNSTYKLTQCEYDMLDTIFEKEARFSTVYLIGELKKKGYFENIKCDSKVLVKDILANCEVIE